MRAVDMVGLSVGLLLYVVVLIGGSPIQDVPDLDPVVTTTYGDVQGLRKTYTGEAVDEFKGIPFAAPPLGERRWKRPAKPTPWKGVRQAFHYGQPCTQFSRLFPNTGEDCLTLNIFVPNGVNSSLEAPIPVMVWTYGGGYQTGTSELYPGHQLALTGRVLVVTHNYRLSVLGGLATSDDSSPGSYMIWDTRAALMWVKDNIRQFGGDPSRVTIFGQSAGGAIVSHVVASPLCEGLFHRAIALSGTSSGPIGIQYKHLENTRNVALLEECPTEEDMATLVRCLRTKRADDLDKSGYPAMLILSGKLPGWAPVVDSNIVKMNPKDAFRRGAGRNIDYIIGRTQDDAAGFIYQNMRGTPGDTGNIAADPATLLAVARFLLENYRPGDVDVLIDAVISRYPDLNSTDVLTRTRALSAAITDFVWVSPTHFEANAHSRNAGLNGRKTYVYNFRYRPSFVHYAPWVTGSHSDDLYLIFGEPYRQKLRERLLGNFSSEDHFVSKEMMKYYANFAYSGDPNEGPHKMRRTWPQYVPQTSQYLEFSPQMEARRPDKAMLEKINFWLNEWPKMIVPNSDEIIPFVQTKENQLAFDALTDVTTDFILAMGSTD